MNKVVNFPTVNNPAGGLRAIADKVERGEIFMERVTLVAHGKVFHLGTTSDTAALHASVFDLNAGISALVRQAFPEVE